MPVNNYMDDITDNDPLDPVQPSDEVKDSSSEDEKKVIRLMKAMQASAKNRKNKVPTKVYKNKAKLAGSLRHIVGEYLDCFIILGYDGEGNDIVITEASTRMHNASLTKLIEAFVDKVMMADQIHTTQDTEEDD